MHWTMGIFLFTIAMIMLSSSSRAVPAAFSETGAAYGAVSESPIRFGKLLIGHRGAVSGKEIEISGLRSKEQSDEYRSNEEEWFQLAKAKLQRLGSSVRCGNDSMTLHIPGSRTPHFLIDRGDRSPVPLSAMPASCGFSLKRSRRGVSLVAPYQCCHVSRQDGSYVLPLFIMGVPVQIVCPMSPDLPTVSCFPSGMTITLGARDVKIQVDGSWQSLLLTYSKCSFTLETVGGSLVVTAPFTGGCWEKKATDMQLPLMYGDREVTLSCPVTQPTTIAPTVDVDPTDAQMFNPFLFGRPWWYHPYSHGYPTAPPTAPPTVPPTTTTTPSSPLQDPNQQMFPKMYPMFYPHDFHFGGFPVVPPTVPPTTPPSTTTPPHAQDPYQQMFPQMYPMFYPHDFHPRGFPVVPPTAPPTIPPTTTTTTPPPPLQDPNQQMFPQMYPMFYPHDFHPRGFPVVPPTTPPTTPPPPPPPPPQDLNQQLFPQMYPMFYPYDFHSRGFPTAPPTTPPTTTTTPPPPLQDPNQQMFPQMYPMFYPHDVHSRGFPVAPPTTPPTPPQDLNQQLFPQMYPMFYPYDFHSRGFPTTPPTTTTTTPPPPLQDLNQQMFHQFPSKGFPVAPPPQQPRHSMFPPYMYHFKSPVETSLFEKFTGYPPMYQKFYGPQPFVPPGVKYPFMPQYPKHPI